MKYLYQFMIILAFCLLGELLRAMLPFPIPASVYGMLALLLCLCLGIVKLHQVEDTGSFLIQIMPTLFITSNVGLMTVFSSVAGSLPAVLGISAISTVIVMVVTGRVSQAIIRGREKRNAVE